MADLIGKRIGNYEILNQIGKGGMAAVFRARQLNVRREVAIKVVEVEVAHSPNFIERFRREAEIVANLSHPHILKLFDYGDQDGLLYLVMELQSGGSLADAVRQQPMSLSQTLTLMAQITSALEYAHSEGVIHRDLKPQNVLLDKQGNALLTDFGIAKMMQGDMTTFTNTGMTMGTPAYMAPEQWQGQGIDARADIYALGIMCYEMLSGHVPFRADTPASMMYAHLQEAPPALPATGLKLPVSVDAVVQQAMAKNPDERFSSATAFYQALRDAASGNAIPQRATAVPLAIPTPADSTPRPSNAPPSRRVPVAMIVAGVAVVLIVGIVGAVVFGERNRASQTALTETGQAVMVAVIQTQTAAATPSAPAATVAPTQQTPQDATPEAASAGGAAATNTPEAAIPTATLTLRLSDTSVPATNTPTLTPTPTDMPSATSSNTPMPSATFITATSTETPCATATPVTLLVDPIPPETTDAAITLRVEVENAEWITVASDASNFFFAAGDPITIPLMPGTTYRFAVAAQIKRREVNGCVYGGNLLTTRTDRNGNPLVIVQLPTRTYTATRTNTATATGTSTPTSTRTPTATRILTSTRTYTATRTSTATATGTSTPTPTRTHTATRTSTRTATATRTHTATRTSTRTATATRTHTATRTPSPTSTPTITDTDAATAVLTQTYTPEAFQASVTVTSNSVNLRSGPGSIYARLGVAYKGETYIVVAKIGTGTNQWFLIEWQESRRAWIWSSAVELTGDQGAIEIARTIPAPPPTKTPVPPTVTPAPQAQPTGAPADPPTPSTLIPPTPPPISAVSAH